MSERSEKIDLSDLELALRELRPRPETLNRAVFMYRAGRASARGWVWPLATLVSSTLALGLGFALCLVPTPQVVYVALPSPRSHEGSASPRPLLRADDPERGAWSQYVRLQEQVSLYGLDGLPLPCADEEQPASVESLLHSLQ